jgi:hypothetical protein
MQTILLTGVAAVTAMVVTLDEMLRQAQAAAYPSLPRLDAYAGIVTVAAAD